MELSVQGMLLLETLMEYHLSRLNACIMKPRATKNQSGDLGAVSENNIFFLLGSWKTELRIDWQLSNLNYIQPLTKLKFQVSTYSNPLSKEVTKEQGCSFCMTPRYGIDINATRQSFNQIARKKKTTSPMKIEE